MDESDDREQSRNSPWSSYLPTDVGLAGGPSIEDLGTQLESFVDGASTDMEQIEASIADAGIPMLSDASVAVSSVSESVAGEQADAMIDVGGEVVNVSVKTSGDAATVLLDAGGEAVEVALDEGGDEAAEVVAELLAASLEGV